MSIFFHEEWFFLIKFVFLILFSFFINQCKVPNDWEFLGTWGVSPNNDGLNDLFIPSKFSESTQKMEILFDTASVNLMTIYDTRSSVLVYKSSNYQRNWWNGKLNNTGKLVPAGTYSFFLEIEDVNTFYGYVFILY